MEQYVVSDLIIVLLPKETNWQVFNTIDKSYLFSGTEDKCKSFIKNLKNKTMNFGEALQALKEGKKVSRQGWNGKNMFLVQAGGYSVPLDKLREGSYFTKEFLESEGCTEFKIVPHIDMWAADKTYVTGWLASQTDMQAADWGIVD